jgi:hypothetical protein
MRRQIVPVRSGTRACIGTARPYVPLQGPLDAVVRHHDDLDRSRLSLGHVAACALQGRAVMLAIIRKRSFLDFRRTGVIGDTAKLEA